MYQFLLNNQSQKKVNAVVDFLRSTENTLAEAWAFRRPLSSQRINRIGQSAYLSALLHHLPMF